MLCNIQMLQTSYLHHLSMDEKRNHSFKSPLTVSTVQLIPMHTMQAEVRVAIFS